MRRRLVVACLLAGLGLHPPAARAAGAATGARSDGPVSGPAALRAVRVATGRAAALAARQGAPPSLVRRILATGRDAHLTTTGLTWFWGGARRGVPEDMASSLDTTALTVGEHTLRANVVWGPRRARVFTRTAPGDGGFSVTADHVQLWGPGGTRQVFVPLDGPGGRTWYAGTRAGFPGPLTRMDRLTQDGRLELVTDDPAVLKRMSSSFWAY